VIATLKRRFDYLLQLIVLFLIGSLAIIVIAGVAFRKFGAPLVWYDELASIMLAWLTYYGACLAAVRQAHIGFPTLIEKASPELRRWLIIARLVIVISFFALAAWAGWRVVLALDGFYMASLPWMPRQITQSVIPIGSILFIIAEVLSIPDMMRGGPIANREEVIPIK
jgi:TRAP-type C4-dicarboxylate transport system permease small subunit